MILKLQPFTTPNFVSPVLPSKISAVEMLGGSARVSERQITFHLREIEADELSDLCDQFRAEVFQKAEKKDPRGKA